MSDLLLDDHAMYLLARLDESYNDLEAIWEHGYRTEEETVEIVGDNGPIDVITLARTDALERNSVFWFLTQEFATHVYLLAQNRDISITRRFDWHITLDASIVSLVYLLQNNPNGAYPTDQLIRSIVPVFRLLKARQS